MNVLHVYRTYYPETQGGLQEAIRQISRGLYSCGVQCSVFTLAKNCLPQRVRVDESWVIRSKSVCEISSCDIGLPSALMAFRSAAKAADLINFHYPWPFGDVLALLGNPGKPYVVTYHSDIVRQRFAEVLYAPLRAKFMEEANAVVATSPAYARTSEYLSRSGRSVDVIPLSIDSSRIPETPEVVATQWELRFPKPFFFFVGVLRYYKGLEFLVEAARLTGFDVVIAGDGPERERLRYLSSGLKNIYFLGSISDQDKFALMRLCRAVVFPSHLRAEAFGVSLLEGAALGKALISTEIGTGTSYVNAHEETGIVVPAANAEAFAKAMRILVENPEYAARLGVNAKDRCVRLFDTSRIGQKYLDLYNRVLSFNG